MTIAAVIAEITVRREAKDAVMIAEETAETVIAETATVVAASAETTTVLAETATVPHSTVHPKKKGVTSNVNA